MKKKGSISYDSVHVLYCASDLFDEMCVFHTSIDLSGYKIPQCRVPGSLWYPAEGCS